MRPPRLAGVGCVLARSPQMTQSLLNQPIGISLPSPDHCDHVLGEQLATVSDLIFAGNRAFGCVCRFPGRIECRAQETSRFGVEGAICSKYVHDCSPVWSRFYSCNG